MLRTIIVFLNLIGIFTTSHSFSSLKFNAITTRTAHISSLYAIPKAKAVIAIGLISSMFSLVPPVLALEEGANEGANAKIKKGGASTLQQGISKTITRGVNLDKSDFHGQNLKGVAFQQSIVRDADFRGCNLVGAGFFDATLDGSDFEGADMSQANVELAQFNRANLKNTVFREVYVVGATLFEGVKSIEGSDWTDTELRADQRKYLCGLESAKGTNPSTGVDTRDSLRNGIMKQIMQHDGKVFEMVQQE